MRGGRRLQLVTALHGSRLQAGRAAGCATAPVVLEATQHEGVEYCRAAGASARRHGCRRSQRTVSPEQASKGRCSQWLARRPATPRGTHLGGSADGAGGQRRAQRVPRGQARVERAGHCRRAAGRGQGSVESARFKNAQVERAGCCRRMAGKGPGRASGRREARHGSSSSCCHAWSWQCTLECKPGAAARARVCMRRAGAANNPWGQHMPAGGG